MASAAAASRSRPRSCAEAGRPRPLGGARRPRPRRDRLPRRPRDHRGPRGLGRGRAPAARPPRARLQAVPRPVRRRLPRPGRPARALRGGAAPLLGLAGSTTSGSRRRCPRRTRGCRRSRTVFRGANWFEREAWDLYGIVFEGHPNLTRLLTHDAFVGHPMRKDYPTAQRHVLQDAAGEAARGPRRARRTCSSTSAPRTRRCTGPSACRRSSTGRRSSTPRPRSATCTATSRRWRRSGPTGRSSRTPTGSTTARRS